MSGDRPTISVPGADATYVAQVQAAFDYAYDDHKRQIEAAMTYTMRVRPQIGGLAEFILPPDLLALYRVQQIFEAAGVVYDD